MALTRSLSSQPKYFNSETKAGLPSQLSPFEYIVLGSRFNEICYLQKLMNGDAISAGLCTVN